MPGGVQRPYYLLHVAVDFAEIDYRGPAARNH
jgi:hypothetical protein